MILLAKKYNYICKSYVQSTVGPFFPDTAYNRVRLIITSPRRLPARYLFYRLCS